jgi:hypothetical protein
MPIRSELARSFALTDIETAAAAGLGGAPISTRPTAAPFNGVATAVLLLVLMQSFAPGRSVEGTLLAEGIGLESIISLTILLLHHEGRDHAKCAARYGEDRRANCPRVSYRLTLGVYRR